MNREWSGTFIPEDVFSIKNLTWTQKILFNEIRDEQYHDGHKGCYFSNQYFANLLNVSQATISNGISKLKKLGLIEIESFDGRKRCIKMDFIEVIRKNENCL